LNFTSKDIELIKIFKKCLGLKNKIGRKARGGEKIKRYYMVQFGDVTFYRFLLSIGLQPNKSKVLGKIIILDDFFFDFLRGHLDGDGTFFSYWDPRWRSSFMFYTVFVSASKKHIEWLREEIKKRLEIHGHITKDGNKIAYQLKYAKTESLKLLQKIYYRRGIVRLSRKYLKIRKALGIIGKQNII